MLNGHTPPINYRRVSRSLLCAMSLLLAACGGTSTSTSSSSSSSSSSASSSASSTSSGLPVTPRVKAFPTAEGYGSVAVGGRGGDVYEVTNINDSGEGSLRAAVAASGPRTVVFRVSGTIDLKSELKILNPNITIAGQTAPGDGITLKRYPLVIAADEVIVRYIRVRLGDETGGASDAISSRYFKNIILDHVSASWSVDETLSIYHCENVTIQWSIIAESLFNSNHDKGAHGFGGIWGSNYSTYHHNLLAHHTARNPRFASGAGNNDVRNNVIYNWSDNSTYGGEKQQGTSDQYNFVNINLVANYYKPGPATPTGVLSYRIANPSGGGSGYGKWYIADNVVAGNAAVSANNWNGGVQFDETLTDLSVVKLEQPWPAMAIDQHTAEEAYQRVLDNAGVTLPKRDAVDARIIDETRNGYATYDGATYKAQQANPDFGKAIGIIDSPTDVGGWPQLNSTPAPDDRDHDGMPDAWEAAQGLNPDDARDRNIVAADGYTMLEHYLNSID